MPNAVAAAVLGIAGAHPNLRVLLPLPAGGGWEGVAFDGEVESKGKSKSDPSPTLPCAQGREHG
jgi:hypothetical protein